MPSISGLPLKIVHIYNNTGYVSKHNIHYYISMGATLEFFHPWSIWIRIMLPDPDSEEDLYKYKNSSLKRNRNLRTLLQYVLYKNVVLCTRSKKIRIKLKIKVYTGNKTEDNSRVFFCCFQGIHLIKNSSFNS